MVKPREMGSVRCMKIEYTIERKKYNKPMEEGKKTEECVHTSLPQRLWSSHLKSRLPSPSQVQC